MNIQIKHYVDGSILFEYDKEDNTISETLREAARQGISLRGAELSFYNIDCVGLHDVDLRKAQFELSRIYNTNFYGTDLRGANFKRAIIIESSFDKANLLGANFKDSKIYSCHLEEALNVPDGQIPLACPSDGAFIGWKKVYNALVKLQIPADAKRSSATTQKCRCSKAKVLAITDLETDESLKTILNNGYGETWYEVGKMVYPDAFDSNRWNECSNGIHFFIDKQDAINY